MERKGHEQTVHVHVGSLFTCASLERKGHVQTVHICLGSLFSHVVERKGHVQTVHVYSWIIIHTCQRVKEGSRADCARIFRIIIHMCQRGKEG